MAVRAPGVCSDVERPRLVWSDRQQTASNLAASQTDTRVRYGQAVAAILGAKLGPVLTNAAISGALLKRERAISFETSHMVRRRRPDGEMVTRPVAVWSRSLWTEAGRSHVNAMLHDRARKLIGSQAATSERPKLITLTIRDAGASWAARGALRAFLQHLRDHARKYHARISYLWVAEVQTRLALHYHLVVTGLPYTHWAIIQAWWPLGATQIKAVDAAHALDYALKYVRKTLGSTAKSSDIRTILHSASGLRTYGCTRDLSTRPEVVPAFIAEIATMSGVEVASLDWYIVRSSDMVITVAPGQEPLFWDYRRLKWHLIQRPPETSSE
jgi:hypothetical protein